MIAAFTCPLFNLANGRIGGIIKKSPFNPKPYYQMFLDDDKTPKKVVRVPHRRRELVPPFIHWCSFLADTIHQNLEALGRANRISFLAEYGRLPTDEEAIQYYEQNGGPEAFSRAHSKAG